MNYNASKKFLINRTDALGDTLLSMPMGIYIKSLEPDSEVTFLISEKFGDLPKIIRGDIQFVVLSEQGLFKKFFFLWKLFVNLRPTHFIYMGGDRLALTISWLRRVPFRGGLKSRLATFLLMNKGVRQSRKKILKHECRYNLELLSPLYQDLDISKIKLDQILPKFDFANIQIDGNLLPKKPFVVVHPGMSGQSLNWPLEFYAEFMALLDQEKNGIYDFVVSYTPSDKVYLDGVKKYLKQHKLQGAIHYFDGSKLGLAHYAKFISHARLFLGPSTGTTHLAAMIGIKTMGIYSPIRVQRKERWGLLGPEAQAVDPETIVTTKENNEVTKDQAISLMANISPLWVLSQLEKCKETERDDNKY